MKNDTEKIIVAPSLLSADFTRIGEAVSLIERAGGDWIHLDVMDGVFVPNLTFGQKMVKDIRAITDLPLDVHLMIGDPEKYIRSFAEAGSDHITLHYEAVIHVHRILGSIRELGKKAGISIVPSTPAEQLSEVLGMVDLILIMTVNPGFGGQRLIKSCLKKVRYFNRVRSERGFNYLIEVDGGVDSTTADLVRDAGADVLVSGSAFFSSSNPGREILTLKGKKVI
ncbi:MAG: ribulose-phosphate 3-epimerase [Spirochaetes bacterium]|nr:MAG: ribulose-phosphate 3-epimerase [Spirochaetota bacterium]